MNLETLKKAEDLDIIIDKMLEKEETVPEFAKKCERYAADRIESYTSKVTGMRAVKLQELVEEHSGELMDTVCEIGRAYYKNGMKAGAALLLQLIGF